jgi:Zn-dependent protease/CBS domain-containing protein
MGDDIKLGRIAGFPVTMNWSVLVIAWLLTWSLADGSFPHEAPGHSPGIYWVTGAAAALVLFASLLAHELSHALVAKRNGVEVKGLTLWLFGGVASLGGESPTPGADFRIAAAGPATSLGLAAGFGTLAVALQTLGVAHLVVVAARWLSAINLMLGVFNLIPGAPLDGGRVLRSYLWHRHGDRVRAAVTAAHAGTVVAYGFIGFGLVEFLAGASVGGLWLVFIGWFVLSAARAEEAAVLSRDALGGVRVADVMSARPVVAPGWITVGEFIERYLLGNRHSAYPVEGLDGTITGLVTLAQLRGVSPGERDRTRVADIAVPIADIAVARPGDSLVRVLEQLTPSAGGRALVFDHDALVGIVTATDIAHAAELRGLHGGSDVTAP